MISLSLCKFNLILQICTEQDSKTKYFIQNFYNGCRFWVHRFILPSEGVTCVPGTQIRDFREPVEKVHRFDQNSESVYLVHRFAKFRICVPGTQVTANHLGEKEGIKTMGPKAFAKLLQVSWSLNHLLTCPEARVHAISSGRSRCVVSFQLLCSWIRQSVAQNNPFAFLSRFKSTKLPEIPL